MKFDFSFASFFFGLKNMFRESEMRLYSVHTNPPATPLLQIIIRNDSEVLHFAIEDDLLIYGSLDLDLDEYRHEIVVMQFCPTTRK
jgi:hypothetical protein